MAERLLQRRLEALVALKEDGVFLTGEYETARRLAMEAYGEMIKKSSLKDVFVDKAEVGRGGGDDIVAQLSASSKKELADAYLSATENGPAWRQRVSALVDSIIRDKHTQGTAVDPQAIATDVLAQVASDISPGAKMALTEAVGSVLDNSKQRGRAAKRKRQDEEPIVQDQHETAGQPLKAHEAAAYYKLYYDQQYQAEQLAAAARAEADEAYIQHNQVSQHSQQPPPPPPRGSPPLA